MTEHEKEIFGISGGVDDIGVATVTVPYYAQTLEECFSVALSRIVVGLPEHSRTFQHSEGGLYVVNVLYQGQEKPTAEPKLVRYGLRGSFEEEAIEANPLINELVKKYNGQWKDARVIFPATYTEAANASGGLSKGDNKEKKNPMAGVEKYKKLGVIWQRTYATSSIPGNVLSRVGRVIDSPPGTPPELRGRTKWLVMPPNTDTRGNVTEVSEEYLLLDEDDADGIYKKAPST